MIKDNVEKIFRRIVLHNGLNNLNSIPHSDVFLPEMESLFGISRADLEIIISILKESHKIMVMEISKEDKDKKLEKVQGYVDADLMTISKLGNIFHRALEEEYENQSGQKKTALHVIKELIPRMQYISHTPMGKLLNKAIMLNEFERMLEKDYKDFSEEWKEENLNLQLELNKSVLEGVGKRKDDSKIIEKVPESVLPAPKKSQRAVDSSQHEEFQMQSNRVSVNKVLKIYGVDFFFRVNLRKCNFKYIKEVLESGVIDRRSDLMLLKEMMKKIKANMPFDSELENYHDEIMSLDRIVSRAISFSKK